MARNEKLLTYTPVGVLCFADNLWKARPAATGGKPRYSCILLFDQRGTKSQAYQELRKACVVAIGEKFGAQKAADPAFVRTLRLPFRNASDKSYEGFEDGEIYISPWKDGEQDPPQIVNLQNAEIDHSQVWSGQMARATVRAFAYDQSGNKGVAFGLEHVQIVKRDMPRLDGRRSASEAFKHADNTELEALGIDPKADELVGAGVADDDIPF